MCKIFSEALLKAVSSLNKDVYDLFKNHPYFDKFAKKVRSKLLAS